MPHLQVLDPVDVDVDVDGNVSSHRHLGSYLCRISASRRPLRRVRDEEHPALASLDVN